jgi:hypothetical protein
MARSTSATASRLYPVSGSEKETGRFPGLSCKIFRFVASLVLPSSILHVAVNVSHMQHFIC